MRGRSLTDVIQESKRCCTVTLKQRSRAAGSGGIVAQARRGNSASGGGGFRRITTSAGCDPSRSTRRAQGGGHLWLLNAKECEIPTSGKRRAKVGVPRALRTAIESRGAGDDWGYFILFFTSILFQPRSRSGVNSGSFFSFFVSACIAGSWRWFIFMAGSPKTKIFRTSLSLIGGVRAKWSSLALRRTKNQKRQDFAKRSSHSWSYLLESDLTISPPCPLCSQLSKSK